MVTRAISRAPTRARLMQASATGRRFITLVPARQEIKPLIISDHTGFAYSSTKTTCQRLDRSIQITHPLYLNSKYLVLYTNRSMSRARHHRRHHTWPHCGSEVCMREPLSVGYRVFKPAKLPPGHSSWEFQEATIVPLIAEEVTNDDAEMAGIVRAPRVHRLWSLSLGKGRDKGTPISASTVEARESVHRSVLRRLIRRPILNKTRSLIVVPTTMNVRDQAVITGWMPSRPGARPVVASDRIRQDLSALDAARLVAERKHRRCHSEQPRSWRRPSAGLWTLQEERESMHSGNS